MQNQCENKILKVFVYNVRACKISKKDFAQKIAKSKKNTSKSPKRQKKWR